jgi:CubicO group peptidase (beta-lactamase class C family)
VLEHGLHAYSSDFGRPPDVTLLSPSTLWAAGGILSTPADVAAFYRALFQGRLLPARLAHVVVAINGGDALSQAAEAALGTLTNVAYRGSERRLDGGWIVSPASSIATNLCSRRARVSGFFASWSR